jgi:hypothetical protein
MKIPRKFLKAAAGLFSPGGKVLGKPDSAKGLQSAWSKKKQGIPFAKLEDLRRSESTLLRGRKMKTDKYGNKNTLSVNEELGRVNQWRRGETYAPGESSKFNPFK